MSYAFKFNIDLHYATLTLFCSGRIYPFPWICFDILRPDEASYTVNFYHFQCVLDPLLPLTPDFYGKINIYRDKILLT